MCDFFTFSYPIFFGSGKIRGDGGSRTRVRRASPKASTYLVHLLIFVKWIADAQAPLPYRKFSLTKHPFEQCFAILPWATFSESPAGETYRKRGCQLLSSHCVIIVGICFSLGCIYVQHRTSTVCSF